MPLPFKRSITLSETKAEPTSAELQQQQRLQDFVIARLEVSFAGKVAREINSVVSAAAKTVENFGANANLEDHFVDFNKKLIELFDWQYDRTARTFADDMLNALQKSYRMKIETKDQGGIFNAALLQFIRENAAKQVQHVTTTTKLMINAAIRTSVENQAGPHEMAKLIRARAGGVVAGNRAKVIARTETHSAAQFGNNAAAMSTGLTIRKYWIAADDERTRPDHVAAYNYSRDNIVMQDQSFSVGGEAMMYPGDPSGSAAQIVNCRCGTVYRPVV